MYCSLSVLYGLMLPIWGLALAVRTEDVGEPAVYVVAYLEVMPPATADAMMLLRQYRDASCQEAGHVRLEILQQQHRTNQFVLLEVWRTQAAFDTHSLAAHTQHFREKMQPLRLSPLDERVHNSLETAAMPPSVAPGAIYVVTHADAIPPALLPSPPSIATITCVGYALQREFLTNLGFSSCLEALEAQGLSPQGWALHFWGFRARGALRDGVLCHNAPDRRHATLMRVAPPRVCLARRTFR